MLEEATTNATHAAKAKQINIRLTAEQERLLRQHCNRNDQSTQEAVTEALRRVIDGF